MLESPVVVWSVDDKSDETFLLLLCAELFRLDIRFSRFRLLDFFERCFLWRPSRLELLDLRRRTGLRDLERRRSRLEERDLFLYLLLSLSEDVFLLFLALLGFFVSTMSRSSSLDSSIGSTILFKTGLTVLTRRRCLSGASVPGKSCGSRWTSFALPLGKSSL